MRATASLFPLPLVVAITLADVAASNDSQARSNIRPSTSRSADLVGYGLNTNILFLRSSPADTGEWGNYPRIWLELANRSNRPLWVVVRLTAPFPDQVCEKRLSLERKERARMLCTQDSVVAGVDYTVDITAFADSGFAETMGTSQWNLQLEKSDVEEWESRHRFDLAHEEAKRLPRSYEHIILKSGFVEGVRGEFTKSGGGGTLTVSSDSLEYVSAKGTLSLSGSQLHRVWMDFSKDEVLVEYDDGTRSAKLTFARARQATFNDLLFLETSIGELIKRKNPTPAAAAVPAPHAVTPEPVSHKALHLAVGDVGISFGNAPRVHGLRFNWRDRELQRVNGLNLTVLATEQNPGAVIRGIAVTLYAEPGYGVQEIDGVGLSPTFISAERSRGILVGGSFVNAADAAGIQLGGLGVVVGDARGIQVGGIGVAGSSLAGLSVGGVGLRAPILSGINVGGFVVLGEQRLNGINAGAIVGSSEHVAGIAIGGVVGSGDRLTGVGAGLLVFAHHITGIAAGGWVGRSGWGQTLLEDATLHGLAAAGLSMTDDLSGLSVAGYNRVDGVQRGVTIGLVNDARDLRGVQIGIMNTARNNRGAFRTLPILNVHFGR